MNNDVKVSFIGDLSKFPKRSEYLQVLDSVFKDSDELFIGTTGNTAREMYHFMPQTSNFYMAGNMGGALSVGFGAAKAGKSVIVCGGDAEFVMHLGGLTTSSRYENINLTYLIFDNKSNKSTGGQNSYQEHVDYLNLARSCGVNSTFEINSISEFKTSIKRIKELDEISMVHINCSYDPISPRPDKEVIQASKKIFLSKI